MPIKVDNIGSGSGTGTGGASALADLTDVQIISTADKQLLQFDSILGKWKNLDLRQAVPDNTVFGMTVDGGGTEVATGIKGYATITAKCNVSDWYVAADTVGSITFDIKYGGTSVVGTGTPPRLIASMVDHGYISNWTKTNFQVADVVQFSVLSASGVKWVNLVISGNKT